MPFRPMSRDQVWLLPPSLDELIPSDHTARFVAAFVDGFERETWIGMGLRLTAAAVGAWAYHPRALVSVWLYGFVIGVRSTRKLETACWDQVPFLWLKGWQHPDHNTLWRFYQAHRGAMRQLFRRTVRTAIKLNLVDLALQAVDGTKVVGNAAKDRTHDQSEMVQILERVDAAITDLEAQNKEESPPASPRLPADLARQEALREQVEVALAEMSEEDGPTRVNLTDPDAVLLKGRQGYVVGYNAQVMVSPLKTEAGERRGQLLTAAEVVTDPDDHAQLLPMMAAARAITGQDAAVTLGDGGYHSGPNLAACAAQGQTILMPEAQTAELANPYHKDHFTYDPTTDTYTCPEGQTLTFRGVKERTDRPRTRVYRAPVEVCRACPVLALCTHLRREGRSLEIGPHEAALRAHRALMATSAAKATYRQRQTLPEPTFGILKEQQSGRRFLLRGLENVRAEWTLLATAFNLRTLARRWRRGDPLARHRMTSATA
jgi:transposase